MLFSMPTWMFDSILISYFLILILLTYSIIRKEKHFTLGQMFLMIICLWCIPIIGAVIVSLLIFRKSKLPV